MESILEEPITCESLFNYMYERAEVYEPVVSAAKYRKKANTLCGKIVGTWCVCKYYQIAGAENMLDFEYWARMLRTWVIELKTLDIKKNGSKSNVLKKVFLTDNKCDSQPVARQVAAATFTEAKIPDNAHIDEACAAFTTSINGLIDAISDGDADFDDYIYNTFGIKL